MRLRCYGTSTTGRRQENEDSFLAQVFEKPRGCLRALVAVCDGMGGELGGRMASLLAVREIGQRLDSPPKEEERVEPWIRAVAGGVQETLVQAGAERPDLSGMGTTLVLGLVTDASIWVAHIGDSRAYRVNGDRAERLTRDHTALQDAVDRGLYRIEEVGEGGFAAQMGSALLRNLGAGSNPAPDIVRLPLVSGEVFLFCTDGLSGSLVRPLVSEGDIFNQVHGTREIAQATKNLVSLGFQYGSSDNITAVCLEMGDLSRSSPTVEREPDVETLRKREAREREKRERQRRQKRIYRRLVLPFTAAVVSLCMAILYIQWRQPSGPSLGPSEKKPADIAPEQTPATPINKTKARPETKPVSISWMADKARDEKGIHTDEELRFHYDQGVSPNVEIFVIATKNKDPRHPEMKKIKVKKPEDRRTTPKELGLGPDTWSLKLRLETLNAHPIESSPIEVKVKK